MYHMAQSAVPFLALLALPFILASGCRPTAEKVELRGERGHITERYETQGDSVRHGVSEQYDEAGRLTARQEYREGLLDGERVIFDNEGNVVVRERYRKGNFEGPYRFYYPSGQVELEGNYRNNVMTGEWKRYYPNGQLMEIVQFEQNEENGPFVEYYENGKLKAEGQYYHGDNEHGLLKLYDESGDLIRTMECDSGRCQTTWKRDDQE